MNTELARKRWIAFGKGMGLVIVVTLGSLLVTAFMAVRLGLGYEWALPRWFYKVYGFDVYDAFIISCLIITTLQLFLIPFAVFS